jgi:ribosome-binding factor A
MDSTRRARLQSLILEELAVVIPREVKDPRVPAITITRVEVTPDAGNATVFFTLLGALGEDTPEHRQHAKECIEGLNSAAGYLRRHLSKVLTVRSVPTVTFREDRGFVNTMRVNELLQQISKEPKDSR